MPIPIPSWRSCGDVRAHPVHGMADREANLRWVERYQRLAEDNQRLKRKVAATTHSLARAFDRIRRLLIERGYLGESEDDVTEHGQLLARLYSESDLLAAECIRQRVWHGLAPAELAAVVSTLVYEARRDSTAEAKVPAGPVNKAWQETVRLWSDLVEDERRHRLDPHP